MTGAGRVVLIVVQVVFGVAFLFFVLRGALSRPDTPPRRRRWMATCFGVMFLCWGAQGLLDYLGAMPRGIWILYLVGISSGLVGSILLFRGVRRASLS